MAQYEILGTEGEKVVIDGVEYDGGVGARVELSDEVGATAVAESKARLVEETTGGDTANGTGDSAAAAEGEQA